MDYLGPMDQASKCGALHFPDEKGSLAEPKCTHPSLGAAWPARCNLICSLTPIFRAWSRCLVVTISWSTSDTTTRPWLWSLSYKAAFMNTPVPQLEGLESSRFKPSVSLIQYHTVHNINRGRLCSASNISIHNQLWILTGQDTAQRARQHLLLSQLTLRSRQPVEDRKHGYVYHRHGNFREMFDYKAKKTIC